MRKASFEITLSPSDRAQLEQWESAQGTPQQVALRCRIILMALAGEQNQTIAARLGVSRPTVNLWRRASAGFWHRRSVGDCTGSWSQAVLRSSQAGRHHQLDPADQAQRDDALELSADGRGARGQQGHGESVVAAAQHQAAPESNVQAFARCEILGETDRRGGAVPQPAAKGGGALFG